jgi:hypothetical protein
MAFIMAHEAVAACGKLRKVNTSNTAASAAVGGVSRYAVQNELKRKSCAP